MCIEKLSKFCLVIDFNYLVFRNLFKYKCIYKFTWKFIYIYVYIYVWIVLGSSVVKYPPAIQETHVQSLGQEVPLEKAMATHSNILAWEIPWTEKPGGLQCIGSQKSRTQLYIYVHIYKLDYLIMGMIFYFYLQGIQYNTVFVFLHILTLGTELKKIISFANEEQITLLGNMEHLQRQFVSNALKMIFFRGSWVLG